MKALQFVGALIAIACFVMSTIVMYHVVQVSAPEWFTLWAVSTGMFFCSFMISLLAKE